METIFYYLYAIEILLIFISCAVMVDPFFYWTHRKGYHTPGWKFLVTVPLWLGLLGSGQVVVDSMNLIKDNTSVLTMPGYFSLFMLVLVPVTIGVGVNFVVIRLLPKQSRRVSGSKRSKIPFASIGCGMLILTGIVCIASIILKAGDILECVRLVMLAITGSGIMFYLARRANTPTVEKTLRLDSRLPLIYLRSFDQETGGFAVVSDKDAQRYSEITSYRPNQLTHNLTLEQFLSREINQTIGPFIALGNPTDYLPPEGAYRTYASDGNWKDHFTDWSNRSVVILMQMGSSNNLKWELGSIRERGLHQKLFIVTPPLASKAGRFSMTSAYTRLTNKIKGIRPASWEEFAASLERAGYQTPKTDPGSGAVITFDEQGQPQTLVSGAKTPQEYIEAICKQLGHIPDRYLNKS